MRGTPDNFVETFHNGGQTDMLACMRAYKEIGFNGAIQQVERLTCQTPNGVKVDQGDRGHGYEGSAMVQVV